MKTNQIIEWIEKYEAGEVTADSYAGSWEELMRAIAAGAIGDDSAVDLIEHCGALADKSGRQWDDEWVERLGVPKIGGGWADTAIGAWAGILGGHHKDDGDECPFTMMLVKCGTVADDQVSR